MGSRAPRIEAASVPRSMPVNRFRAEVPQEALPSGASSNTLVSNGQADAPPCTLGIEMTTVGIKPHRSRRASAPLEDLAWVACLSHEMAQPLTAVASLIHAGRSLLREDGPRELASNLLEQAAKEIDRLSQILVSARELASQAKVVRVSVDLPQAARRVIERAEMAFDVSKVKFTLNAPQVLPHVWVDPVQIEQVLSNLLGNAAHAINDGQRDGGSVTVHLTQLSAVEIEVAVIDDGPGIDAELLPLVLEPFFTTRQEGTGMGLYICRKILERHGSKLVVESPKTGGCVCSFGLPVMVPKRAAHMAPSLVSYDPPEERAA